MKITLGKFDPETRSVPATFKTGEIAHKRSINAVLKSDGSYDAAATRTRAEEVGRGVAAKISLGVIGNEPEPAAE
ncbi:hypothetical protein SAMN06295912_102254 [Sphingomonas laterariae]|uniref:Uncharacterized protein n=1 Tax=Edaphosphingomonas laterariae TaxID=861865 RepID=A0A239CL52_9SPHN|nr:hypothetical protein [Sphingomonas laterariae]SNS20448.1 hypothetical protein SAMN06295912_102254 [Sphingomonas laterariae]